jgi:hypothetical protein
MWLTWRLEALLSMVWYSRIVVKIFTFTEILAILVQPLNFGLVAGKITGVAFFQRDSGRGKSVWRKRRNEKAGKQLKTNDSAKSLIQRHQ